MCAHSEKRDDAVSSDGLQEAWSSSHTLETGSASGKEGAKHNDPWRRPRQSPNHQVTIDPFTKPVERRQNCCSCCHSRLYWKQMEE